MPLRLSHVVHMFMIWNRLGWQFCISLPSAIKLWFIKFYSATLYVESFEPEPGETKDFLLRFNLIARSSCVWSGVSFGFNFKIEAELCDINSKSRRLKSFGAMHAERNWNSRPPIFSSKAMKILCKTLVDSSCKLKWIFPHVSWNLITYLCKRERSTAAHLALAANKIKLKQSMTGGLGFAFFLNDATESRKHSKDVASRQWIIQISLQSSSCPGSDFWTCKNLKFSSKVSKRFRVANKFLLLNENFPQNFSQPDCGSTSARFVGN